MTTSVSLHRSLRKVPVFRSLPRQELETIIEQMICKEYKPGDVLWRTSSQTDFMGIVQSGEMVVEYQINGSVVRSVKFSAGDFVLPPNLKGTNRHSFALARAVTDVKLYVLRMEQIEALRAKWLDASVTPFPKRRAIQDMPWHRYWMVIVALLIIFLTRNDVSRILSGVLYMSTQARQSDNNSQTSLALLQYAEFLDSGAVFAHNQEGTIWFQQDNLPVAEASFLKALDIEQNNGPALNNLAVTNFSTARVQQAVILQQKAVQSNPDSAIVRYNLGIVLMKQNYNVEALREFKQATYINPTWALPYTQMGFIYLQMQDDINAEQAARSAIRLDPAQQSAHLILAIALYNQSKNQEALKSVEHALRIDPANRISRFYQARILSNLSEFEPALSIFKQLLRSANDSKQISRLTAEIEALHRSMPNVPANAR